MRGTCESSAPLAFLEELSQVCVLRAQCAIAPCAGLVTDSAHNMGDDCSVHSPGTAPKTAQLALLC